jgi:hypothetical protein
MKRHHVFATAILAGLFAFGAAGMAYSAQDNTAKPPAQKVPFDHKSLGKDVKDCVKCHKSAAPEKK